MRSLLSRAFGFSTTVFDTVVEPVVAVTGRVWGKLPRATCIYQQRFALVWAQSPAVRRSRITATGSRSDGRPMDRQPMDRYVPRRAPSVNG